MAVIPKAKVVAFPMQLALKAEGTMLTNQLMAEADRAPFPTLPKSEAKGIASIVQIMPETDRAASPAQLMSVANRVASTHVIMAEANQVASQEMPKPEDNKVAPQPTHEAGMASYTESALPHDSAENFVAHHPQPKEVTLVHCTGGYTMFGPCWLAGAH